MITVTWKDGWVFTHLILCIDKIDNTLLALFSTTVCFTLTATRSYFVSDLRQSSPCPHSAGYHSSFTSRFRIQGWELTLQAKLKEVRFVHRKDLFFKNKSHNQNITTKLSFGVRETVVVSRRQVVATIKKEEDFTDHSRGYQGRPKYQLFNWSDKVSRQNWKSHKLPYMLAEEEGDVTIAEMSTDSRA